MNSTDNYILIDYKKLAKQLAEERFFLVVEQDHHFSEIYEEVDESGNFYMKPQFQTLFEAMEEEWQQTLLEFDITNSVL